MSRKITFSKNLIDIVNGFNSSPGTSENLCILGGWETADDTLLDRVIDCFHDVGFKYTVSQYTDALSLSKYGSGYNIADSKGSISRIRMFGASESSAESLIPEIGGDLDVRVDGQNLYWRYVGAKKDHLVDRIKAENLNSFNYWHEKSTVELRVCRPPNLLFWGQYDGDEKCWFDNRVAAASLEYPIDKKHNQVSLGYLEFSEANVPAFCWWLDLEDGDTQ